MTAPTVVYSSPDAQSGVNNGGNQTYTMSGTQVDDLIVVMGGHPFRSGTPIGPLAEGFTWTQRFISNSASPAWGLWTAPITSGNLADTTVTGQGSGNGQDGTAYTVTVLRGVDLTDPIAVISSTTTPNTTRNPPSVVTPVDDCLVMACAAAPVPDAAVVVLSGYSSLAHSYANDTNDITVVSCVKAVATAGTEDPPEYVGLTNTTPRSITVAFRPVADEPPIEYPDPTENMVRNSDFENDTHNALWSVFQNGEITFPASAGIDGGKCLRLEAIANASPYAEFAESDPLMIPIDPDWVGDYLTAYAEYKWDSVNTPNELTRLNVYFLDESFAVVQGFVGAPFTTSASSWTRTQQNSNQIPAGTAWAKLRVIMNTALDGDAILVDRLYAVVGADIPDVGPHPPWTPYPGETVPVEYPDPTKNMVRNSDFSNDTQNALWSEFQNGDLTFPLKGINMGKCLRMEALLSGNPYAEMNESEDILIPIDPAWVGEYFMGYAEYKWDSTNTPNANTRLNVYFLDAAFGTLVSHIGTPFTPSASAWVRTQNNDNQIPADTAWVKLRVIINSAVAGDAVLVDRLHGVVGANIINAGPHPQWEVYPGETPPDTSSFFQFL